MNMFLEWNCCLSTWPRWVLCQQIWSLCNPLHRRTSTLHLLLGNSTREQSGHREGRQKMLWYLPHCRSCCWSNHVSDTSQLYYYFYYSHCVNGKVGDDLIAAHAKRTQNVWPDQHKFVPWLVFNNASVADSQNWLQNIPAALCDWFVGDKEKLEKCGDISRVNYVSEPCYRNIDKMENSVEEF